MVWAMGWQRRRVLRHCLTVGPSIAAGEFEQGAPREVAASVLAVLALIPRLGVVPGEPPPRGRVSLLQVQARSAPRSPQKLPRQLVVSPAAHRPKSAAGPSSALPKPVVVLVLALTPELAGAAQMLG